MLILANSIALNIYSIALLIIIYIETIKHDEKQSLQHRLFVSMIWTTILLLVTDMSSRFDGNPGTIYTSINHTGNFLIFLINSILPSLWLLYVHYQVYHEENRTRKLFYPLAILNMLNAIMVILSQFNGWFYFIDSNNIYHRGPFYLLSTSVTLGLVSMSYVLIISNRKKIEKKYYFSLLFFAVPPLVLIFLQIKFYGIPLMLNGTALSLLILLLNIQNQQIHIDYLTGVSNRKRLESYLREKVNTSTEHKTFSAIMLDLNNFKSINDNFGHDAGDMVLKTAAKLLKSCVRQQDLIARYGGDEFCIVLDISDKKTLESAVQRIKNCIEKYNEISGSPYKIGFSMGYRVYDYYSNMSVEQFQKHIDILMYESKQLYKKTKPF